VLLSRRESVVERLTVPEASAVEVDDDVDEPRTKRAPRLVLLLVVLHELLLSLTMS
jgi:hypothetical protein